MDSLSIICCFILCLIGCDASSSQHLRLTRRSKSSMEHFEKRFTSSDPFFQEPPQENPPFCFYPPSAPIPPSTTPPIPPPGPRPPPSPSAAPTLPEYAPSPPVSIPNPPPPPEFVPRPPIFRPPVVYPGPFVPPPPLLATDAGRRLWCVAKPSVPDPILQEAMNYACGSGADCGSIQPNGSCYQPDTPISHASFAFNSYWQRMKGAGGTCDFGGTAILVTKDPSYFGCHYIIT